jgi:hypothetical protein
MAFIRAKATNVDGSEREVRYEGPKDEFGRSPIGYLAPSGKTYVHPMYAWAKTIGAPDESIRAAHRGIDGNGNEGVSDQRWIYDTQEAAQMEREMPERYVRAES